MADKNDIFPEKFVRQILARERQATQAFKELIRAKVKEDQLILDLYNIHLNPHSKRGPYLRGKKDKTAKSFPKQLGRLACKIENVNTGTLFYELLLAHRRDARSTRKQSWVLHNDYRKTLEDFQGLPAVLRAYSEFIGFAIRQKKRRPSLQACLVISLIDHVKQATGRPHYREIEGLLDAIFRKRGISSPYDRKGLEELNRRTRRLITPLALSRNDLK
jgi:hypothetical protein